MAATPKASWPGVRALLHSVDDQPDAASMHAQFDRILEALADKLPRVAEHLEAARADVLAFTAFRQRSLAPDLEQHRLRVAQPRDPPPHRRRRHFPDRDALIRLLGPCSPSHTAKGPKAAVSGSVDPDPTTKAHGRIGPRPRSRTPRSKPPRSGVGGAPRPAGGAWGPSPRRSEARYRNGARRPAGSERGSNAEPQPLV